MEKNQLDDVLSTTYRTRMVGLLGASSAPALI